MKRLKKLLKSAQRLVRRYKKPLLRVGVPLVLIAIAFALGRWYQQFQAVRSQPTNLVWAVDNTVKVPDDLRRYLLGLHDCKGYRGTDSAEGVGLWAVTQVEQGRYAKITYGCSWALSSYIVAVKQDKDWELLQPVEYFAGDGDGNPHCSTVVRYKIPVQLEGFCLNEAGKLTKNPNPEE